MTKVAIFTTARSDMTFLTPLIKKMNKEAGIQLLLFVGGAHLKKEYGNTINEIKKLKIKITENFDYLFSGSSKKKY